MCRTLFPKGTGLRYPTGCRHSLGTACWAELVWPVVPRPRLTANPCPLGAQPTWDALVNLGKKARSWASMSSSAYCHSLANIPATRPIFSILTLMVSLSCSKPFHHSPHGPQGRVQAPPTGWTLRPFKVQFQPIFVPSSNACNVLQAQEDTYAPPMGQHCHISKLLHVLFPFLVACT